MVTLLSMIDPSWIDQLRGPIGLLCRCYGSVCLLIRRTGFQNCQLLSLQSTLPIWRVLGLHHFFLICIIAAWIKQVKNANSHRCQVPFTQRDYAYVSAVNITLPKGILRKISPKYIGLYLITKDFGNNLFQVQLPDGLQVWGIHNIFHASLLCIYENDDCLFPGCSEA